MSTTRAAIPLRRPDHDHQNRWSPSTGISDHLPPDWV